MVGTVAQLHPLFTRIPAESSTTWVLLDQPPGPSFDRFPELPQELQMLIWSYAFHPYTYNTQSRLYQLYTYTLSLPLPSPIEYRPLITSPPPNQYLSKSQIAERLRNPPPPYCAITTYTRVGRREKWKGLFNLLHSCKLARQLGLEAWLQGIEDKHEVHPPRGVDEIFMMQDLVKLLKELLERVKR